VTLPTVVSPDVHRRSVDSELGLGVMPSLMGLKVLLVEDEADSRDLAIAAHEACGADVTAVSSSAEALGVLLSASPMGLPDVLVSDVGMPVEDGYDLIRQVRSLQPERGGRVPALTVTGYTTPEDVNRALAAGYQLHVPKPVDPMTLVSAVAELVRADHPADKTRR
jgi:CheY-like chemotaxis protein